MKLPVKIALGVVFFLALAGILAALYLYNKQHKDLQKVKPDYVITASELQKEFESDESGSTAKYVNRIIEVSGIIGSVKRGEQNIVSVTLKTESDFSVVICTFPPATDPEKLVTGKNVTIRGECSGFLMDVLLNNCAVVK
ncbi:MAG: OB-fold putative lipoprotein [Bacteroidales bacterium]|nr:OB-fold putative lipoprotein [Bacteroidales bacterium]